MNKIKKIFSNLSDLIKLTFKRFPITMIIIYVLTILFTININNDVIPYNIMEHIIAVSIISGIAIFSIEAVSEDKKDIRRYICMLFAIILAIMFDVVTYNNIIVDTILFRIMVAYISTIILITVYALIKKSELNLEEYVLKTLLSFLRSTVTYIVFSLGIMLLSSIFILLIWNSGNWSFIFRILTLLTGIYYIPACIHSLVDKNAEDTKFNKKLIICVLLPLILIAMLIIYIYIIKIIFITKIPNNVVFRILASIFMLALPVYIVSKNYKKENKVVASIINAMPYLYVPFIILEIYSIALRISEFGITVPRYLACAFIICQILIIVLSILKEGKYLSRILIYLAVIIAIATITPVNAERISNLSQKKILEEFIKMNVSFDELSKEEKTKYASSYDALSSESKEKEYINNNISNEDKEKLKEYSPYFSYDYEKSEYITLDKELSDLDISEYSRIYKVDYNDYNTLDNNEIVHDTTQQKSVSVDLKDYIQNIIDKNENSEKSLYSYFSSEGITKTDKENIDLYITDLYVTYIKNSNEIDYVSLNGYLLEK